LRQEIRQLAGVKLGLTSRAGRYQLAAARFELASELGKKRQRLGVRISEYGRGILPTMTTP